MIRQPFAGLGLFAVVLVVACTSDTSGPSQPRPRIVDLQAGMSTTCALLDDGSLWCWGPGIGGVGPAADLGPIREPVRDSVRSFALGNAALCAVTSAQETYCWGYWFPIDVSVSYGAQPTLLTDTLTLVSMAAGNGHTCGILISGEPVCWGSSFMGKRGLGVPDPTLGSTVPNKVVGATGYRSVKAGWNHTCGLVESGGLVTCWGVADMLGDSSSLVDSSLTDCFYGPCARSPVLVGGVSGVQQLAVGQEGTCVLGSGLRCWGYFGGTLLPRPAVVSLPDVAAFVSVGNGFACALTVNGQAYCWGRPGTWLGHQGLATTPTAVETNQRFRLLAAGNEHACGVTLDDKVYCWGEPTFGTLGPGIDEGTSVPTLVRGPW